MGRSDTQKKTILMNIPTNFSLLSVVRKEERQRTYPHAVCLYDTCQCAAVPVPTFRKRTAMDIMLGHPISKDLVDAIRFEMGMTVAPLISWFFNPYVTNVIYIYGAPILDVSRSHTTTQHSR